MKNTTATIAPTNAKESRDALSYDDQGEMDHDYGYDNYDEEGSARGSARHSTMPEADRDSLYGALGALTGWLNLPAKRRESNDAFSQALFDCAFNLVESETAKIKLAQQGADIALSRDDANSLRSFIALGAQYPGLSRLKADAAAKKSGLGANETEEISAADEAMKYRDLWRESVIYHCANKGLFKCLALFTEIGILNEDAKVTQNLLKEPEINPLRQIDLTFLKQLETQRSHLDAEDSLDIGEDTKQDAGSLSVNAMTDPVKKGAAKQKAQAKAQSMASMAQEAADAGHDLILALLGATADHSEHLGLSIAISDLLQSNPLFVAIQTRQHKDQKEARGYWTDSEPPISKSDFIQLTDQLVPSLFEPQKASHKAAMLSLALNTDYAARLAFKAGITPTEGGSAILEDYQRKLSNPKGFLGLSPELQKVCATWVSEDGFGERLFDWNQRQVISTLKELARDKERTEKKGHTFHRPSSNSSEALRDIQGLKALCDTKTEKGFEPPGADALLACREALDLQLIDGASYLSEKVFKAATELGASLASVTLKKGRVLKA